MSSLFIDESKAAGYTLVAAAVASREISDLRRSVARLRKAGQRRIHFVNESNQRRREILSALGRLGVRAHVFYATGQSEPVARELCLNAVATFSARAGVTRIVIERDESIVDFDRRTLYRALERAGARNSVTYVHEAAGAEPLLWTADAIAWAWARGSEWRPRVRELVDTVSLVD